MQLQFLNLVLLEVFSSQFKKIAPKNNLTYIYNLIIDIFTKALNRPF